MHVLLHFQLTRGQLVSLICHYCSNVVRYVRTKIFQHWFFSENFTIERWWVSDVRNVKKMGGHRLHFGENMPGRTHKSVCLSKSGFISEEIYQLELWREIFSAKFGLSVPIKWIQSTGDVRQRTSSHLATIVSHALLPQDGRIPCPVDRNLEIFLTSHIDFLFVFGQCGDNCK